MPKSAVVKSQRYSLDQYLVTHQKLHAIFEELNEPMAESKKVEDFMKGITDPRLSTA